LPYKRALLHGHCHQKAFDAVTPILQVLNWIPELNTELIESSCCGMAGSFGYEAEHVDASLHMAELSLFPRIRNSDNNTLLIADGISCRHQIHGGLGRQSLHIAKVLDMALA
jgi:Fe-S oxidoreductase